MTTTSREFNRQQINMARFSHPGSASVSVICEALEDAYTLIDALAEENAGLKEIIEQHAGSVAVCPNCSHEEPSETDDIVVFYRSMKTPATDAFLAEARAQEAENV